MSALLAFHLIGAIAGIGAAISALEYLVILPQFASESVFAWRVFRTRLGAPPLPLLGTARDRLFEKNGIRALMLTRLVAAVALTIPILPVRATGIAAAVIFLTSMVMTYRSGYGEDGSDQMLTIVAAGLLSFALLPESTPWRPIGLWFIAAQSVLSYTAAGISKLAAPLWRNGQASLMIFRTETYSNPTVAHLLERSRPAQIALAWTTILFECLFPLALFAPMPVAVTLLALGFVFHLANAFVMGLNVFFWAFVATYPAVLLLRLAIMS